MSRKLAVIGASYLQEPLVRRASDLGFETICFAWEDGAICRNICDRFYPVSIIDKESILTVCREERIDGVVTIASDVAAPTVAFVAENMGLMGNSYKSACYAHNKFLMRNAFVDKGVPCPKYRMVKSYTEDLSTRFDCPVIVKPTDRSGSMGVQKVCKPEDLKLSVENALNCSFSHEAIVEEFIDGREISVEFISYKGVHYPLTITDKVTTGAPYFVELEHHQPADLPSSLYTYIYSLTAKALSALGVTNGASHSEYKITPAGKVYIMETGARMGGDFIGSDLVRLSTGYDFLKGVIEVALGTFTVPKIGGVKKHSGVYFLCEESKYLLDVFGNINEHPEIVSLDISDPQLHSVRKSSDRSGYFIYQSETKLDVC